MTLYLLDANVFIRAHEDYYPINRIPQFWAWLLEKAQASVIKMPFQIYDEVAPHPGELAEWMRRPDVKRNLVLAENTDAVRVQHVLTRGYAPDLTDVEIDEIGRDPFLIAAALNGPDRVVVTREVSKPNAKRSNRKIPDVCRDFALGCINDFELYRRLRFSIP